MQAATHTTPFSCTRSLHAMELASRRWPRPGAACQSRRGCTLVSFRPRQPEDLQLPATPAVAAAATRAAGARAATVRINGAVPRSVTASGSSFQGLRANASSSPGAGSLDDGSGSGSKSSSMGTAIRWFYAPAMLLVLFILVSNADVFCRQLGMGAARIRLLVLAMVCQGLGLGVCGAALQDSSSSSSTATGQAAEPPTPADWYQWLLSCITVGFACFAAAAWGFTLPTVAMAAAVVLAVGYVPRWYGREAAVSLLQVLCVVLGVANAAAYHEVLGSAVWSGWPPSYVLPCLQQLLGTWPEWLVRWLPGLVPLVVAAAAVSWRGSGGLAAGGRNLALVASAVHGAVFWHVVY